MMRLASGETEPSGCGAVHGVAHRLKFEDFATLTNMEHEYRWLPCPDAYAALQLIYDLDIPGVLMLAWACC